MRCAGNTITAGILAAVICTGAVAAASVTRRHTAAGDAQARAELLSRTQLGAGWHVSAAAPRSAPALTCSAFDPTVSGAVEQGAAASPTFEQSSNGPFAGQVSYVYASPAQQGTVWRRVVRPALGRCIKQSLVQGSGKGVTFTASGVSQFSLSGLPATTAAYRVSGTASAPGQSVPVFLDVIVLGRGASISELSLSSFQQPVTRTLERRLARALALRMPAA